MNMCHTLNKKVGLPEATGQPPTHPTIKESK